MSELPTVYTVGHSNQPVERLVEILEANGVGLVVDVRRFPGSRRNPQFGSEALSGRLAEHGIGYVHEPDLGGRRRPRPDTPNGAWRVEGFRGYADHMDTPAFRAALARVQARAAEVAVALMCAEALWHRCHRRLLADALVARGHPVVHLLGPRRADRHVPPPFARFDGAGGVVYPPASSSVPGGGGSPAEADPGASEDGSTSRTGSGAETDPA